MYLDSFNGNTGDKVELQSPLVNLTQPKQIQFYYNMFLNANDTTTALELFAVSQLHAYEPTLFEVSGDHGDSWHLATACLPVGVYSLAFVGTVGLTYVSDLAIDDISFTTTPCTPQTFNNSTGEWVNPCSHQDIWRIEEMENMMVDTPAFHLRMHVSKEWISQKQLTARARKGLIVHDCFQVCGWVYMWMLDGLNLV